MNMNRLDFTFVNHTRLKDNIIHCVTQIPNCNADSVVNFIYRWSHFAEYSIGRKWRFYYLPVAFIVLGTKPVESR